VDEKLNQPKGGEWIMAKKRKAKKAAKKAVKKRKKKKK
jgi:hypothetical protein